MSSTHLSHIHNKYFINIRKRSYDDIWDTENNHPFQIPKLKKQKLHGLEFNEYPKKYLEQNSKNTIKFACKNNSSKSKKRTFATVQRQWNAIAFENENSNENEIDFDMHLNDPRPMKKFRILSKTNETLKESNNDSFSTILEMKDDKNMEIVEYNDLYLENLLHLNFKPRNDRFLKLQLNEFNGALVVYKDVNQEIINDAKEKKKENDCNSMMVVDENQIFGAVQNRRINENKNRYIYTYI